MAWSVPAIRDALKAALVTVAVPGDPGGNKLRAFDVVPSQLEPPAALVVPGDPYIQYDQAFGSAAAGDGADQISFVVVLLVALASERVAQDALDAYIAPAGSSSVKTAVEGNLGGAVVDCSVAAVGAPKLEGLVGTDQQYLGVRFTVDVMV